MDVYRALYEVDEQTQLGEWLRAFWDGSPPPGDPLWELLEPQDLRGEVRAWGNEPHGTCLDAETTDDPDGYTRIVKSICRASAPPLIRPRKLAIYGKIALVIEFSSPELSGLRLTLAAATSHVIARAPLTDEEFQRAEWWIGLVGKNVAGNVKALHRARALYRDAGAPPLPGCRHFRMSYYVRLCKALWRARKRRLTRERDLRFFFDTGLPHWYRRKPPYHKTIASALEANTARQRQRLLGHYNQVLWPVVRQKVGAYRPGYLAIMGEHAKKKVTVHFYDWLTETFVEEERPAFTVLDRVPFASGP